MASNLSLLFLLACAALLTPATLAESPFKVLTEHPSSPFGDMMGLGIDSEHHIVNAAAAKGKARRKGVAWDNPGHWKLFEDWKPGRNAEDKRPAHAHNRNSKREPTCGCPATYTQKKREVFSKRTGTTIIQGEDGDWDRWPNKLVKWKFESGGPQVTSQKINDALDKFSAKLGTGCILFEEVTNPGADDDYIKIVNLGDGVCNSYIGRIGYEQEMSLGDGCEAEVVIQHEFMHALGFYHEHNRADRSNAVIVKFENTNSDYCSAFEKCADCRLVTEYNIQSIMHYPSYGFSCNGEDTLVKKDGSSIPYNHDIQDTDVAAIKALYSCDAPNVGCFEHVNYLGSEHNVEIINDISSAIECQNRCQLAAECNYFVHWPNKKCYLKRQKGDEVKALKATSGKKYC